MRGTILLFTSLILQASFSNAKNTLEWWQEIKPKDERAHLSDAIVSLETCAAVEQNPVGTCNKTIKQLETFLHWAYQHPEQLVPNNATVCGKPTFNVKTPFAESCTSRHQNGQPEAQCQKLFNEERNCPFPPPYDKGPKGDWIHTLCTGKWSGRMFPISNPSRNNLPSMAVSLGNCLEYTLEWNILSLVEFVEYLECQEGGKKAGCLGQVIFDIIGMKVMNPLIILPSEAS